MGDRSEADNRKALQAARARRLFNIANHTINLGDLVRDPDHPKEYHEFQGVSCSPENPHLVIIEAYNRDDYTNEDQRIKTLNIQVLERYGIKTSYTHGPRPKTPDNSERSRY